LRQEPETDGVAWNAYVHATIAFIDRDLSKLKDYRELVARSKTQVNLQAVDNLIKFFDNRYAIAYAGPINSGDALVDFLVWGTFVRIDPEAYPSALRTEVEHHLRRAVVFVSNRDRALTTEGESVRAAALNYERLLAVFAVDDAAATLAHAYVDSLQPCSDWKGLHECPERQARFADEYQAAHPDGPFSIYLPLLAAHRWLCTAEAYENEMQADAAERSRRFYQEKLEIARESSTLLIRAAAQSLAERNRCFAPR
jgi:hypothetical protein